MNPEPSLARVRLHALIGVVGISFSAIWVRLSEASVATAAFYRAAYALPVLLVLRMAAGRPDGRSRRQRLGAFLAGTALGADLLAWHRAIELVGAGLATVLGNLQVFFVALGAWWLHRERPRRAALLALPLMFFGVLLVSGLGRPASYGADPVRGVFFGVLTAILYALFLLLFRRFSDRRGPSLAPWLDATAGTLFGAWALSPLAGGVDYTPSWPAHGWLLVLALVSQAFGWLLITRSLPKMPAVETSLLLLAQPALTVTWGWLLLAEQLSRLQLAGALLILAGLAVVSLPRPPAERLPAAARPDGPAP